MLSCFVDNTVYCAISAGKNIELYQVKEPDSRVIVASFPINEDLTYFEICDNGIIINNYICNPVTGKFIYGHIAQVPKYNIKGQSNV